MNVPLIALILVTLYIYNLIRSTVLFLIPRRFRKKKDITGQTVLITGAGSGLGREMAIEFSKHSVYLVLLDINKDSLEETSRLLDRDSQAFLYECDVTDREMVYATAKRIKDDVGDVDILVQNAGVVCGKSLLDLPDDEILKTMEVNVISHFWTCKSFLPSMMAKNRGHIVTIASAAGVAGTPKLTDYCASKFAAIGLLESLQMELRWKNLYGIKTTIVNPSLIDTGLFGGTKLTFVSMLTPKYAAEEIVQGVLEERERMFLPHYLIFVYVFKSISPRWLFIKVIELTGSLKSMENFRGRNATPDEASNGHEHSN